MWYLAWHPGGVSILRCCRTSIENPMIKIRRSHDRLIFIMEISLSGKTAFILRRALVAIFGIEISLPYQFNQGTAIHLKSEFRMSVLWRTTIWRSRTPCSQWQHSFQTKAALPLAKRLETAWYRLARVPQTQPNLTLQPIFSGLQVAITWRTTYIVVSTLAGRSIKPIWTNPTVQYRDRQLRVEPEWPLYHFTRTISRHHRLILFR